MCLLLNWCFAAGGFAQDDELEETYFAFGVSMTAGMSGVLEVHITRWTTDEERDSLAQVLWNEGQEKREQ